MLRIGRLSLRAGAMVLGCAAALAAVFSLYAIATPLLLKETIAHSRDILTAFKSADRNISHYRYQTGKLPPPDKLNPNGGTVYQVTIIDPSLNSYAECCEDTVRLLGVPPPNSYLLEIWRGEWSEYYAPWSGKSTLSFDPNDYALTGDLFVDAVLSVVLMMTLGYASVRVWNAGEGSADGL